MHWFERGSWIATIGRTGARPSLSVGGMVSSPHEWATSVGVGVLEAGGNAVDAALAVSAALGVVAPDQCSIGGDAFWLIAPPGRPVESLNGSGRSPASLSLERLVTLGLSRMPDRGPLTVTVPGLVDTWRVVHERYGTLSLATLLQPAICLALNGFPVSARLRASLARSEAVLRERQELAAIFLPSGNLPQIGEVLVQTSLAKSLEAIARQPQIIYQGDLAYKIAATVKSEGGYLEYADLSNHLSDWVVPVAHHYRNVNVVSCPPNSQGLAALIALGALDLVAVGRPPTVVEQLAAKRLAFQLRDRFMTDATAMKVDALSLVEPRILEDLASTIRRGKISLSTSHSITPPRGRGDTSYFAVIDAAGMGASVIQSTFGDFGSGIAVPGTGIVLQNRGAYFGLDPNHANVLAPAKRTLHTLAPFMFVSGGTLVGALGAMGADGQVQTLIQLAVAMVDRMLDPAEAVVSPRWLHGQDTDGQETVWVEQRLESPTIQQLQDAGYRVKTLGPFHQLMGHAQVILRDVDGRMAGAADPRSDGLALGTIQTRSPSSSRPLR